MGKYEKVHFSTRKTDSIHIPPDLEHRLPFLGALPPELGGLAEHVPEVALATCDDPWVESQTVPANIPTSKKNRTSEHPNIQAKSYQRTSQNPIKIVPANIPKSNQMGSKIGRRSHLPTKRLPLVLTHMACGSLDLKAEFQLEASFVFGWTPPKLLLFFFFRWRCLSNPYKTPVPPTKKTPTCHTSLTSKTSSGR